MADHWPLAAGLLLGLAPRLVFARDGTRRRSALALGALAAIAVLVLRACATAINDDEVFYLADSWARRLGETAGALPMRYLAFRPLLLFRSPSAALVAGRVLMAASAVVCAVVTAWLARRAGAAPRDAVLAGVLALVWIANAGEGVLLRPEQIATTLVLLGIALLVAAPLQWRPALTTGAAFFLLTLAASISHRRVPLVPVAAAVLLWSRPRGERRRELTWAAAGIAAAVLPSLLYVAAADSFASLWYWNWTFVVRHSWVPRSGFGTGFPVAPFLVGAAGAVAALLDRRERASAAGPLAVFWLASTAAAVLVPFTLPYALGSWMALGIALGARLASRMLAPPAVPAAQRIGALAVGVLGVTPLLGPGVVRLVRSPPPVGSQLALIDWLHDVADGGPVVCVSPYHPIKASNAWRLWNAWWYCYLRDPAFHRALNPHLGETLRSEESRLIEWDPWPQASGYRNVLHFAIAAGFVPRREAQAAVSDLRRNYRLVRWARPLPERFGGGRFLLQRQVPLDDRVVVLPDARITP